MTSWSPAKVYHITVTRTDWVNGVPTVTVVTDNAAFPPTDTLGNVTYIYAIPAAQQALFALIPDNVTSESFTTKDWIGFSGSNITRTNPDDPSTANGSEISVLIN
jgi:hypothetical protein